jgi:hypothetical protein
MNCTPTTPTLSEAEADTVVDVPDTEEPFDGAVTDTEGAVVSATVRVKFRGELVR